MERPSTELQVSTPVLAELLAVLEPGAELVEATLLSGGLANTNYRLQTRSGPDRALRLVTRSPASAAKEALLLRELESCDEVPVPRLLAEAPAGTAGVAAPALLLEFLPGQTLEQALPSLDARGARDLGRALGLASASLHQRRFQRGGDLIARGTTLEVRPWSFPGEDSGEGSEAGSGEDALARYIAYCLDRTPTGRRLGPLKEEVRAFFVATQGRWEPEPECLVHGDFKPCNLFVERVAGRWHLRGILDWEFAHAGTPYSDYGNLFRQRRPALPDGFEEAFRAGLSAGGVELPSEWAQRRAVVDLTSALDFLSSERDLPRRHAASLAQVRATLALPLAPEEG